MELNDLVYKKIVKLSEQGDELADNFKYDKAILKYEQALNLLPKPIYNWEAATWLLTALGDGYYLNDKYETSLNYFLEAEKCPDGLDNPFIYVRIGECFYELNNFKQAQDYLIRAYMLDGEEVFSDADPKYLNYIKALI